MKKRVSMAVGIGGTFDSIGRFYEPNSGASGTAFNSFASTVFGFLTMLAGIMFILYFIMGGLSWITAGGDAQKVEKAKSQLTNAAIGLIVVVAAYGIAFIIGSVLGLEVLNPAAILNNL